MKVLCITEFFPATTAIDAHGGMEVRAFYVANYLARRHEISIIASPEPGKPDFRLPKLDIHRVGWTRSSSGSGQIVARWVFMLAAIWKGLGLDFDVVEGAGLVSWLPAWVLGIVKRKKKTIVVADTVDAYVAVSPVSPFLKLYETFFLSRKWSGILCISKTIRQKIAPRLSGQTPVEVIYCGVDVQSASRLKIKKSSVQTICCVSRLVSYKRMSDLLQAAVNLKKKVPAVKIHIVGTGEELPRLKQFISSKQLQSTVIFHGFIRSHLEVLKLIKSAHVFCLPSTVEGFGIVNVEALACGVPVVLPGLPLYREITGDRGVLFYQPENPSALARNLYKLLSNTWLYRRLQQQTRSVVQKYDWEIIGRKTQKLYESLCAD